MTIYLRDLRIKQGWTMAQSAKGIGISESYYSLIENGERRPSVEIAKKIANLFGFDWTLFYDDTQTKDAS